MVSVIIATGQLKQRCARVLVAQKIEIQRPLIIKSRQGYLLLTQTLQAADRSTRLLLKNPGSYNALRGLIVLVVLAAAHLTPARPPISVVTSAVRGVA